MIFGEPHSASDIHGEHEPDRMNRIEDEEDPPTSKALRRAGEDEQSLRSVDDQLITTNGAMHGQEGGGPLDTVIDLNPEFFVI